MVQGCLSNFQALNYAVASSMVNVTLAQPSMAEKTGQTTTIIPSHCYKKVRVCMADLPEQIQGGKIFDLAKEGFDGRVQKCWRLKRVLHLLLLLLYYYYYYWGGLLKKLKQGAAARWWRFAGHCCFLLHLLLRTPQNLDVFGLWRTR